MAWIRRRKPAGTSRGRARRPRRTHGVVAVACTLGVTASAWAQVTITKVWPNQIRYTSGEEAVFEIALKNAGPKRWTGRVTGVIESRLSQVTPVLDQPVTIAPGKEARFKATHKIQLPEFGHALMVTATGPDGAVAAQAREVFSVGRWYYNIGHCRTIFSLRKRANTPRKLNKILSGWRANYVTVVEHFAGSPGTWGGLVPQTEEWFSGQGAFPEGKKEEKALIEACHRNGMAVTVYYQRGCWGSAAEEYVRAHPDMVSYDEKGRCGWFNMAKLDHLRTMTDKTHKTMSPAGFSPHVADPKVQAFGIDEIIRCARMFDYDGVRWDGHTIHRTYNVFGEQVKGDLDEMNRQWVQYMETSLQKVLPGFTVNYNYHPQTLGKGPNFRFPKMYKALGPNAYVLWERMRSDYKNANNPLNVWTNVVRAVRSEVNRYSRPGGNFQHVGWYASPSQIHRNHTQAIYYALGAHWDTWNELRYAAFAMRYGAFLWDTKLENLADPTPLVDVAGPAKRIWWKPFVQQRRLDSGRRLVITHLINRPVHERQNPHEKDAPPVQQNVRVTLTPEASEKVVRASVLNPDANRNAWSVKARITRKDGRASVTVPSVEFWTLVVWELARSE